MIKGILPYVLIPIAAIAIFVGGFWAGTWTFARIKSTTLLQDYMIRSVEETIILHYLDQKKIEQARQMLLMHQDSAIVTIDGLAKIADKQSYVTACRILKRIAKSRKEHPPLYASYNDLGVSEKDVKDIKQNITRILDKWTSVSCD